MTSHIRYNDLIGNILYNRRYFVEQNGQGSRWRNPKNGLPQRSVISPVLSNNYTNGQSVHKSTRSFIYADDLCIAIHDASFEKTESILSDTLDNTGEYYARNHLRVNTEKIQTCVIRTEKPTDSCKELEHTLTPTYLILDITLIYSTHIATVKAKTAARTNFPKKPSNSK